MRTPYKQTPINTPENTIRVGNLIFVSSEKGIIETLFNPINGRTADGTWKLVSGGIMFRNLQGEPWLFLVANRHNERFFVTCHRTEDGRTRYMFSTSTRDEDAIGIESYAAKRELAEAVWFNHGKPNQAVSALRS